MTDTLNLPLSATPNMLPAPDFKIGYGDYLRFRDLVLERTGLNFHEKKRVDLENGLLKVLGESPLASHNGHNLDSFYHLLRDRDNPAGRVEMERLINALTVGETHFFRDEAQFNALANEVLPSLIMRKRAAAAAIGPDIQPQLRLWSVGCASGEEPFSLAILLKELLPDLDSWYVLILATDINQIALHRAQKAVYSDWSFREPRAKALRPRYFTRYAAAATARDPYAGKDRYRLRDDIRQMVTFTSLNLIEDDYPAIHTNTVSMDLILCRNVTIYFAEETTRRVIKQLHAGLIDGGWLVVGHSEPSLTLYQDFQTHIFASTVLYQKTDRRYALPDGPPEPTPAPVSLPLSAKPATAPLHLAVVDCYGQPQPPQTAAADPYEVAGVLLNQGCIQEAIDELQRKLSTDPYFAPAHAMLGRAYANLGQWSKARYWCESAIKLDNLQSEAYHVLGMIYQHEGQLASAIEMLKKAIYLEREAPLLHFNLALLYKKAGYTDHAQRACRNTIRVLEKWPPASIVPDSGGSTAKHLLDAARRVLGELGVGSKLNPRISTKRHE